MSEHMLVRGPLVGLLALATDRISSGAVTAERLQRRDRLGRCSSEYRGVDVPHFLSFIWLGGHNMNGRLVVY